MKKFLLISFSIIFSGFMYAQSCADLFISEYIEGWSNNKALELYNPTPNAIDLSAYRLVRYSNGQNVPPPEQQWMVQLSGTIQPYRTFVIVIDKRDPEGTGQEAPVWDDLQDRADVFLCEDYDVSWTMYFNGDDAMSLEKNNGEFVDILGKYGERPLNETGGTSNPTGGWSTVFPYSTGEGVIITRDHTMFRKADVTEGVKVNPAHFNPMAEYDTLWANTFTNLNWHDNVCMTGGNTKPDFTQENYEFSLPSGSPAGTSVGFVEAIDAEDDVVDYFITWGNPYHPFMIDRATGEIKVDIPEQIINETYILTLNATDGTSPVEATATITVASSIDEADLYELAITPNPVINGKFKITSTEHIISARVIDLLGREIGQMDNASKSNEMFMELGEQAKGIYLVIIKLGNDKSFTKKITVK
jgi:hypothetical protein